MQSKMNRKGLWLLLTLAVLIVAVSVLVAVAISADGAPANSGEIEDFSYQTVRDAGVLDSDTDLRFLFSIRADKLGDYRAVGFVFSKNNSDPVKESRIVDAVEKRNYYSTDQVYSSVNANGTPIAAPDGRYWVAVSLSDIGHSYFDGALYVRPFVEDTDGTTRYGETKYITVCSALGHTHTVSGSANEGQLFVSGHCDDCNLDGVKQYGNTSNPWLKKWTSADSESIYTKSVSLDTLLGGGKHFYPDSSNKYQGNDLLIEYSVLWNETLLNLNAGAYIDTRFANNEGIDNKGVCYWSLADAVSNSDSPFAGSFEYSGLPNIAADGVSYTPAGMIPPAGSSYDDYPNIGGADQLNPEWGWHRIGIRVHQEVLNLETMKADVSHVGNAVAPEYYITSTTYIDGVPVSKLCGYSLISDNSTNYELYHCTSTGEGDVTYSDGYLSGKYLFIFYIHATKSTSSSPAYFIAGDPYATVGHSFVQNVTKVVNPEPRTETHDGKVFTAPFYYTTVGAHEHDWDNTYVVAEAATLLKNGTEAEHCNVCGQSHNKRDSSIPYSPNVQVWTNSSSGQYEMKASLKAIRDGKHFYPAASNDYQGNDLLIEYSILWNESMLNLLGGDNKPHITTRIANRSGERDNNLVYWSPVADNNDASAKFAGAFEYGTMTTSEPGNPFPRMTAKYNDITAYPNIGGVNSGDGLAQSNTEYGWHRVSIRLHQDLTNEASLRADNVAGNTAATYKYTTTIYIDGVLVSILSSTKISANKDDYYNTLFTATSDGKGGITYNDAPKDRFAYAFRFNNIQAKSDKTVRCAIADVYMTCGHNFVQDVIRVENPDPVNADLGWGSIPTQLYYAENPGIKSWYSRQILTNSSSGGYSANKAQLGTVRGDKHFYEEGNDLLVEYSVLWNETVPDLLGTAGPYIDTRFTADADGSSGSKNIIYWSLAANTSGSDCKFAGGFEWGGCKVSEADNPYPRFTSAENNGGIGIGTNVYHFPNIGGINSGDGLSQTNDKYGWHRVSIRYREIVTNADALKSDKVAGATAATYKLEMWCYVDGILVIHSSVDDLMDSSNDRKLYSARSDGAGNIVYTENDSLWLHGSYLHSTQAASDKTVYFAIADYSATCGSEFVQDVIRAENPASSSFDFGTSEIDVPMYYAPNPGVKSWYSRQLLTTSSSGSYSANKAKLGTIRGSNHFYDNDLLIEYSVLWNETVPNLKVTDNKKPYIDTRFSANYSGSKAKNIIYWSPAANIDGSDCKYAGGFEWGGCGNNEADNPYSRFNSGINNSTYYPNIGGYNNGDGTPQTNDLYGWHRVSIRYRQRVTNESALRADEVAGATAATYKLEMWVYIDGILVIHSYANDLIYTEEDKPDEDRKLFSAQSNGAGGINYTENDDLWLHGTFLNSTTAASGTVYFAIADYSATCGSAFVQDVEKVPSPVSKSISVDGNTITTTVYYQPKVMP